MYLYDTSPVGVVKVVAIGAGRLEFDSQAGQIRHNVAVHFGVMPRL